MKGRRREENNESAQSSSRSRRKRSRRALSSELQASRSKLLGRPGEQAGKWRRRVWKIMSVFIFARLGVISCLQESDDGGEFLAPREPNVFLRRPEPPIRAS